MRRDDDLSLVAGITKDQRWMLKAGGVPTRRGLASLAGARMQARLQVASAGAGRIQYELLDPERDQGGTLDQQTPPHRPRLERLLASHEAMVL